MRIYTDPLTAVRETERDLWEMSIEVHPQTMQDKVVADDPNYMTKEVRGYGFKINEWEFNQPVANKVVDYLIDPKHAESVKLYLELEFIDRVNGVPVNPGNSFRARPDVWKEFMHEGRFAYTYSERFAPQLERIVRELREKPDTRQAIITIHSYIKPVFNPDMPGAEIIEPSCDLLHMGGGGRVPCSMYYQFLRRQGKLDMIYTMRSCDFLVHFPVDLLLALHMQTWIASRLGTYVGCFTYFTGSLHAYAKDMKTRGIF